jgi:hypothetical protein
MIVTAASTAPWTSRIGAATQYGQVGQWHCCKRRPGGADHKEQQLGSIGMDATRSWVCRRASYPRSRPDFSRRRRAALKPLSSRAVRTVAWDPIRGCECRSRAARPDVGTTLRARNRKLLPHAGHEFGLWRREVSWEGGLSHEPQQSAVASPPAACRLTACRPVAASRRLPTFPFVMRRDRRRRWCPGVWTCARAPGRPSWPPCAVAARSGRD